MRSAPACERVRLAVFEINGRRDAGTGAAAAEAAAAFILPLIRSDAAATWYIPGH